MLQASIGYYICPLTNVALGVVFLKERLSRIGFTGVVLAAVGVGLFGVGLGGSPTIALLLALSFSFYGLLRKRLPVTEITGVTVEMMMLTPLALIYLAYLAATGRIALTRFALSTNLLLVLAGPITVASLICFLGAVRRLRYASAGMLMFLASTISFLLGILVFGEPLTGWQLAGSCCIWAALLVYAIGCIRNTAPGEQGGIQ